MTTPFALNRPLVFVDLETTSAKPHEARIVEISLVIFRPGGDGPEVKTRRLNPTVPIPEEATAIHGIRDEDVAAEPMFSQIASSLLLALDHVDLGGFNLRRYDLPVLEAEFNRCGMTLDVTGRLLLDGMAVFHRMEPRDLAGAVRFYLGREHDGAHSAEVDALAAADVLFAQMERYRDAGLPGDPQELHTWLDESHPYETPVDAWFDRSPSPNPIDWIVRRGKHSGKTLGWVAANEAGFLAWMLFKAGDMPEAVKDVVRPFHSSSR